MQLYTQNNSKNNNKILVWFKRYVKLLMNKYYSWHRDSKHRYLLQEIKVAGWKGVTGVHWASQWQGQYSEGSEKTKQRGLSRWSSDRAKPRVRTQGEWDFEMSWVPLSLAVFLCRVPFVSSSYYLSVWNINMLGKSYRNKCKFSFIFTLPWITAIDWLFVSPPDSYVEIDQQCDGIRR